MPNAMKLMSSTLALALALFLAPQAPAHAAPGAGVSARTVHGRSAGRKKRHAPRATKGSGKSKSKASGGGGSSGGKPVIPASEL
jgi:hypothetical protein